MHRFKYFANDNQSYKVLCREANKLNTESIDLKRRVRMLKKEKFYWIPLLVSCSLVSFAMGHQSVSNETPCHKKKSHLYMFR